MREIPPKEATIKQQTLMSSLKLSIGGLASTLRNHGPRPKDSAGSSLSPKEILLMPLDGDAIPQVYIGSFEDAPEVPFDRDQWRDRTLRLVARRSVAQVEEI
jgi:hypothetical protein